MCRSSWCPRAVTVLRWPGRPPDCSGTGIYGLEGHPNVMPQGPRVPLPNFSTDGNIVTKGPAIAPGVPVAPPQALPPLGSTTPGTTPTTTQPVVPPAGGSSPHGSRPTRTPPSGQSAPARIVAFGSSGRSPPRTAALW